MSTLLRELSFSEQTDILRDRAKTIAELAEKTPDVAVEQLLEAAAAVYRVAPSQMMYALSFADVKNLVKIDYDSETVSAVSSRHSATHRVA